MRLLLAALCFALCSCSLLLSDDDGPDAGDGASVDAGLLQIPEACDRVECPVVEVVISIGSGHRLPDIADWVAARSGDLVNREVIAVANAGEAYVGGAPLVVTGCYAGTVVTPTQQLGPFRLVSLDGAVATGDCAIGAAIEGDPGAHFAGFLGKGTIETGEVFAGDYTDNLTIGPFNTSSDAYMQLIAADDARHLGVSGDGAMVIGTAAGTPAITIAADHTVIDGIEIGGWLGTQRGDPGVEIRANNVELHRLLIGDTVGLGTGEAPGIRFQDAGAQLDDISSALVTNTVITNTSGACVLVDQAFNSLSLFNTTTTNCWSGDQTPAASIDVTAGADLIVQNVIAVESPGAMASFAGGVMSTNVTCFHDLPFEDTVAFSTPALAIDLFVSETDLNLREGSPATNGGTSISIERARRSINGILRPNTSEWDSGAFQSAP